MRKILTAAILSCIAFSASSQSKINDFDILGKWDCTTNVGGVMVQTDSITYYRNQRFSSTGTFMTAINFTNFKPEASAYSTAGNGTWSIKDGYFLSVVEEFSAENLNNKIKNDKFIDEILKSIKKGDTTSVKTIFINSEIWVVEEENEKTITTCTKIKSN